MTNNKHIEIYESNELKSIIFKSENLDKGVRYVYGSVVKYMYSPKFLNRSSSSLGLPLLGIRPEPSADTKDCLTLDKY